MGALEKYFINAPGAYDPAGTASQYIQLANTQKVELATVDEIQDFDFFAAQAIRMDSSMSNLPSILVEGMFSFTRVRYYWENRVQGFLAQRWPWTILSWNSGMESGGIGQLREVAFREGNS